jgi:hypothetical protein
MPHVFALVIAGAGFYAGLKWVSRLVQGADAETKAMKSAAPKDLGVLDRDPQSGIYRPRVK